jgi:YfiH family protein
VTRPTPRAADLNRPLPEPFRPWGQHIAIDLPGARAVFTTRRGGHSEGPYASLNLGSWTDDDPAAVRANREDVQRALGARFAYGRQVHGCHVALASHPTDPQGGEAAPADGQATACAGIAPMVLTADCLPVALVAPGAVAMLHAGWRGLAGGVLAAGVQGLRRLGARGELSAALGPAAGGCCYEVGEEVHAAFAALAPAAREGRRLDLRAIARHLLEEAGVAEVHDCGLCTICSDPALFFSHRRDAGVTGRQAGIVWLAAGGAGGG